MEQGQKERSGEELRREEREGDEEWIGVESKERRVNKERGGGTNK